MAKRHIHTITHVVGSVALLSWLLGGCFLQLALAHGGGEPQLENASAGPYWVSAWSSPSLLRAKETVHLTISVAEPPADPASLEAGAAVLDAVVEIDVSDADGNTVVRTSATHQDATVKYLYETDMTLPNAGAYQVAVVVQGKAGEGQVDFMIELLPETASSLLPLWLSGGAGIVLLFSAVLWRRRRTEGGAA